MRRPKLQLQVECLQLPGNAAKPRKNTDFPKNQRVGAQTETEGKECPRNRVLKFSVKTG